MLRKIKIKLAERRLRRAWGKVARAETRYAAALDERRRRQYEFVTLSYQPTVCEDEWA